MAARDLPLSVLHESRRQFLELVASVRPDLHRYCARMTGSVVDGEDIVQETLARAFYVLSELEELPPLRPWLFRIAHRRAIDHLRRYERRMSDPLDAVTETAQDGGEDPEEALVREEAMRVAITRFVELAPAQRSCVILKDVLGHSLEEIASLLDLTIPSVKAALHRGRAGLREKVAERDHAAAPSYVPSPLVARYAALFNARDWDGVRALLAADVRLDLVSRSQRAGRGDVSHYFTNYGRKTDWHLVPARLEGREVLAVFASARHLDDTRDERVVRPDYFIELSLRLGEIIVIRDFRYVSYVAHEATVELSAVGPAFVPDALGLSPSSRP